MSFDMIINESNKLGFYRFLEANQRAWERFPKTQVEEGQYVVGLNLATHPGALMSSLIFLRFMAHFLKATPMAVVNSTEEETLMNLVGSYGITNIEDFNYVSRENYARALRMMALFEEGRFKDSRSLLNFTIDGVRYGDLIYDGNLRSSLNPARRKDPSELYSYVYKDFCRAYIKAPDLIVPGSTKALLTEFHTYHMFGTLARYAVSKGVPVYMQKPASNVFKVRKYTTSEDILKSERDLEREEFLELYEEYGEFLIQEGRKLLHKRFFTPEEVESHGAMDAFVATEPAWTRERMLTTLGMDSAKPVVCIMSHCFVDEPHGQGGLYFDDYVDWLAKTLRFAKRNDSVNWLVREHPLHKTFYESKFLAEHIVNAEAEGCGWVAMMPDEIKTPNLLELVDCMVTCYGTCSVEFPAFGKPCVALPGWSTGYGFNTVPGNQLEYKRTMQNIADVKAPSQEEQDLANAYFFADQALACVKTKLLPPMTGSFLTETKETLLQAIPIAATLLEETPLTEDPFYYLVKQMVEEGRVNALNYELLPDKGERLQRRFAEKAHAEEEHPTRKAC